jgi:hypothetical protein
MHDDSLDRRVRIQKLVATLRRPDFSVIKNVWTAKFAPFY